MSDHNREYHALKDRIAELEASLDHAREEGLAQQNMRKQAEAALTRTRKDRNDWREAFSRENTRAREAEAALAERDLMYARYFAEPRTVLPTQKDFFDYLRARAEDHSPLPIGALPPDANMAAEATGSSSRAEEGSGT
jgi:hypothetical protein